MADDLVILAGAKPADRRGHRPLWADGQLATRGHLSFRCHDRSVPAANQPHNWKPTEPHGPKKTRSRPWVNAPVGFQPLAVKSAVDTTHTVTRLLQELSAGSETAAEDLIPLIYAELHRIAERQMRRERPDHTLQPTALVHEAFLRLAGQESGWNNRSHFLSVASQAMRRILVDHARRQRSLKRGGQNEKVELNEAIIDSGGAATTVDLEALDRALAKLAALDPRHAKIVELRFFGGLEVVEAAEVLGISAATVKRDWQFAKAWLRRELAEDRA